MGKMKTIMSVGLYLTALSLPLATDCFILDTFFGKEPQTVASLDLAKYIGRWYQVSLFNF